jgi:predicted nuclease of predicted toxin-antitoxin system
MRLLADENLPLVSIRALREAGIDVAAVTEIGPGSSDVQVLEQARSEGRILVTFDRDFGELLYRRRAPVPPGVIYLHFVPTSPQEPAQLLRGLLAMQEIELGDRFTVVERERVRQRPLPRNP